MDGWTAKMFSPLFLFIRYLNVTQERRASSGLDLDTRDTCRVLIDTWFPLDLKKHSILVKDVRKQVPLTPPLHDYRNNSISIVLEYGCL